MILNFDLAKNFWVLNPDLIFPKVFNELYTKDTSKDKQKSSDIMWAIALLVHPKTKYKNLSEGTRKKLIEEDFLKMPNFKWEEYETVQAMFIELSMTKTQKFLYSWEKKLDERQDFFNGVAYSLETAQKLDEMMARTEKLWSHYRQCQKDADTEESKGSVRGGAVESISEQGQI